MEFYDFPYIGNVIIPTDEHGDENTGGWIDMDWHVNSYIANHLLEIWIVMDISWTIKIVTSLEWRIQTPQRKLDFRLVTCFDPYENYLQMEVSKKGGSSKP